LAESTSRSLSTLLKILVNVRRGTLASVIALVAYFFLAFTAMYGLIVSPGMIGLTHDWSMPPLRAQMLQLPNRLYYSWVDTDFGDSLFMVGYFFDIPVLLLSMAGLSPEVITKGFLVATLAVSGFSMFFLCRQSIGSDDFPSFIAGFLYMFTPIVFNRVVDGTIYYLMAYAFAPFAIAYFIQALEANKNNLKFRKAIISGVFLAISSTELQYAPLVLSTLMIYVFVFSAASRSFVTAFKHLAVLFLTTLIAGSLYLPWLLPRFMALRQTLNVGASFAASEHWLFGQFKTDPLNPFLLIWPRNFYPAAMESMGIMWNVIGLIIPLLAFSSAFLLRNRANNRFAKHIICWLILGLVFLFIAQGINAPFGEHIWLWLYRNARFVPAYIGLLYALTPVIALSYAVLISISIHELCRRAGRLRFSVEIMSTGSSCPVKIARVQSKRAICLFTMAMLLLFMVSYSYPSLRMYPECIQTYTLGRFYNDVFDEIQNEEGLFRVFWQPSLSYGMTIPGSNIGGVDMMIDFSPKPSFPQWVGSNSPYYELSYGKAQGAYGGFVTSALYQGKVEGGSLKSWLASEYKGRTKYIGSLLALSSTKYFLLREGFVASQLPSNQYEVAKKVLNEQADMKYVKEVGSISFYENPDYLPMVYVATPAEAAIVTGGFPALVTLDYVTHETKALPRMKLFSFASQLSPEELTFVSNTFNAIIVSHNEFYDLIFASIPPVYRVYPYQFIDNATGWEYVYSFMWSEWNLMGQINGPLTSLSKGATIDICYRAPKTASYEFWAKVQISPESQSVLFALDGKELKNVITNSIGGHRFMWVNLGTVDLAEGTHTIRAFSGERGEGIEILIVAPFEVVNSAKEMIKSLLSGKEYVSISELENPTYLKTVTFEAMEDAWTEGIRCSYGGWNPSWSVGLSTDCVLGDHSIKVNGSTRGLCYDFVHPFDANMYNKLVFWAKAASNDAVIVDLQYPEGSSGRVLVNVTTSWTKIEIPLSEFGNIDWLDRIGRIFIGDSGLGDEGYWDANNTGYIDGLHFADARGWVPIIIGSEASHGMCLKSTGLVDSYVEYPVFIPSDGNYLAYLRLLPKTRTDLNIVLAPENAASNGEMKTVCRDLSVEPTGSFTWYNVTFNGLHKGWYSIRISSVQRDLLADIAMLKFTSRINRSFIMEPADSSEGSIQFACKKVNPTRYEIEINSTTPVFIVNTVNYNDDWYMTTNDEISLRPILANGFEKAYYINATGYHHLSLYYSVQPMFEVGWYLTIVSYVIIVTSYAYLQIRSWTSKKRVEGLGHR